MTEPGLSLAEQEKQAARFIDFRTYQYFLAAAVVTFIVGLFLPHSGEAAGWQVLTFSEAAAKEQVRVTEYAFVIIGTLATLLTGVALLSKRTLFANIGYLFSGMALMLSLLGMWMRLQNAENLGLPGIAVGFYCEVVAVIALVYGLSCTVLRRSRRQLELAAQRAAEEDLDEVGYAQRAALVSRQQNSPETNPLLVDDRRQQAKRRRQGN